MVKRLIKGLVLAIVLGPVAGVLGTIAKRIARARAGRGEPDYVSPPYQQPTGPEVLGRAEDLVLTALRSGPSAGLTNAEVSQRTGLNPVVGQRRGEVTRTILASLVERSLVSKIGQRYTISRP